MKKRISVWGPFLVVILVLAGCSQQTEQPTEQPTATYQYRSDAAPAAEAAAEHPPVEVTPEMEVKLAAADLVDGEEDNVVSNCPTCAFAMEGSDEYVAKVGDYSLQFCSSHCKESFSKDLTASVVAMAVPDAEVPSDPAP